MNIAKKSSSLAEPVMQNLKLIQGKSFALKFQKGVTMIEYALLAGLVALAAISGLNTLAGNVDELFRNIVTHMH